MDPVDYFQGKKITVMGLGLLGGIGDIRYLAEHGAELIVTDLKSAEEAKGTLEALKEFPDIRYTLGKHELADFQGRDLIIKAPSTPADSIYIEAARKEGTHITMWAALFSRFAKEAGAKIVGVTGTRGKTTTTALIADIMIAAGKDVITGGNVQGTAMLPNLESLSPDSVVVLELDSWKLQGFGEEQLSPNVAVFTTFYPDHLNYYHQARERVAKLTLSDSERAQAASSAYKADLDAYLADKANIFLYQIEPDNLIVGSQAAPYVRERYQDEILADFYIATEEDIPKDWELQVPGEHNRYDAACALAAARAMGIDDEISRTAIENFAGVPGRLELIAKMNGVKFYNDTTATTPEATLAALEALGENIILIAGGADKALDMNKLLVEIPKHAKRVILLAGTGTSRVLEFLPGASVYGDLKSAVDEAVKSASPGDSILLSPAFASFGMFKNEYDRGDQFNAIVKGYA